MITSVSPLSPLWSPPLPILDSQQPEGSLTVNQCVPHSMNSLTWFSLGGRDSRQVLKSLPCVILPSLAKLVPCYCWRMPAPPVSRPFTLTIVLVWEVLSPHAHILPFVQVPLPDRHSWITLLNSPTLLFSYHDAHSPVGQTPLSVCLPLCPFRNISSLVYD